jgi:hypothetical protein
MISSKDVTSFGDYPSLGNITTYISYLSSLTHGIATEIIPQTVTNLTFRNFNGNVVPLKVPPSVKTLGLEMARGRDLDYCSIPSTVKKLRFPYSHSHSESIPSHFIVQFGNQYFK